MFQPWTSWLIACHPVGGNWISTKEQQDLTLIDTEIETDHGKEMKLFSPFLDFLEMKDKLMCHALMADACFLILKIQKRNEFLC